MVHGHGRRWLIVLLVAASVWGFVDVRRRGYPYVNTPEEHKTDLTVYTEAGWAFFDGREPYEVSNCRGWTYLYPPMLALMLAPLRPLATQNQVTVWFFISLLLCWGCYREGRRIVAIVCQEDPRVAAIWKRWSPWLGAAAVAVATLPTLNCMQRGQIGVLKFYFLLLGLRCIIGGRTWRAWLAGGVALAMPIVLKILPLVQVGFLVFLLLVDLVKSWLQRRKPDPSVLTVPCEQNTGRRFTASSAGVGLGLLLYFLLIPAALLGWQANLRHLDTWGHFMLTKADDGGMDPRSGNSHTTRNQSMHNAAYRLGNFGAHLFAGGPDDRLVDNWDAPPMAMDSPLAQRLLLLSQATLTLALLALGVRLCRGDGNRLNLAVGFALACAAMLVVSPVARGHYFMLLAPAALLVPLWLAREGRPRAGVVLAAVAPVIPLVHYVLLPYAGRVGFMGLGTAAWLMAAMVVVARTSVHSRDADSAARCPRLAAAA